MWPALMLAARRTLMVAGRTEILAVSIMIRGALNHVGDPDGRRPAKEDLMLKAMPERMMVSHRGRPREVEKRRWEEILRR